MKKALSYNNCFICGQDSEIGLKVKFEMNENGARAIHTPRQDFQGFGGVVHGGILCALLDEIMWKTVNGLTGAITMTGKMDVKFRRPAYVGKALTIQGELLDEKKGANRRYFEAKGTIFDSDGKVLAEATGLYVEPDKERTAKLA
ncbi:MAG: PaaI family thioesterase [Thermincola sp.]|jgi:uncharacterized protein (TIGR00369 family)|nr:PaaI family thioesterase [Thermincola sp.]